jgi:hypothetical protein
MHIGKRRRRVASSEVRMARTAPPGKEDSGTALGAGKKTLAPHSPCPGQRRLWHRPRALALGGAPGQRRLWHALAPSRALAGGPSRTARRAKKTLAPPSRGTARRAKKTLAPPSGKEDSGTALSALSPQPCPRVALAPRPRKDRSPAESRAQIRSPIFFRHRRGRILMEYDRPQGRVRTKTRSKGNIGRLGRPRMRWTARSPRRRPCALPRDVGLNVRLPEILPRLLSVRQYDGLWCYLLPVSPGGGALVATWFLCRGPVWVGSVCPLLMHRPGRGWSWRRCHSRKANAPHSVSW